MLCYSLYNEKLDLLNCIPFGKLDHCDTTKFHLQVGYLFAVAELGPNSRGTTGWGLKK
jgi:hypothetical protein